jgi:tol-pal system protein YbgF
MRFRVPKHWALFGLSFSALFAVTAVASGCAHTDTVADRHIKELGEQIGQEQADQDKSSSRSGLLEMKPESGNTPPSGVATGNKNNAKRDGANRAAAATLGDDDNRENDDPNAPDARPEIRLQGPAGAAASQARASSSRTNKSTASRTKIDDHDDSSSSNSLKSDRPSALDPEAKRAYESAHSLVTSKQYDRALEALSAFITRWPDHPYAENATYWRGECHFAKGEYLRAAEQFEAVLSKYNGTKGPDALLKIGMCHDRLGSSDRAKEYWERLRRDYPRSDAVKRIPGDSSSSSSKTDRSGGSGPR